MRTKKIVLCAVLAAAMCVPCYAKDITVNVDGKTVDFPNQKPVIQDGRTLIPLRGVFDTLGYDISWASDTKTVTMTKDSDVFTIVIGQKNYFLNGVSHEIDVPAQIINGSTMLPLRAVAEAAGMGVVWNAEEKTAMLISGENVVSDETTLVFTDDPADENFLRVYIKINEEFENAIDSYNECLDLIQSDGIHGVEDFNRLASAAAEMKAASDKAHAQISSVECAKKTQALKSAYMKYIEATGANADVVNKFFSGKMETEKYETEMNDTMAAMISAETVYKNVLSQL